MNTITEQFATNILSEFEDDYGDFMRSSNVHLNHLREGTSYYCDLEIEKKLDEMKWYLQYKPDWNIESTRRRLLNDTKYIDDLLNAHLQDWESETHY